MENKKIAILLIILSIFLLGSLFYLISTYQQDSHMSNCFPSSHCKTLSKKLDITHVFVGIVSALLSFGIYLFFFSPSDQALLKRLEDEKNKKLTEDKFSFILKGLDKNEALVYTSVKEQNGITQNTLRLKTDLSKAALSQILTSFEKKNLIRKEAKGKTFAVYLTDEF